MLIRPFRFLVGIVAVVSSSMVSAAVSSSSVLELLDISGLTKQVKEIPALLKSGMTQTREQQLDQIPPEVSDAMINSIGTAVKPSALLAEIGSSIIRGMEQAEVDELLKWYRSDLGRKITQAEEQASTVKASEYIAKHQDALANDFERMSFAKSFDEIIGATEMVLQLQEYTTLAVMSGLSVVLSPGEPLDMEQFRPRSEPRSPALNRVSGSMYKHHSSSLIEILVPEI